MQSQDINIILSFGDEPVSELECLVYYTYSSGSLDEAPSVNIQKIQQYAGETRPYLMIEITETIRNLGEHFWGKLEEEIIAGEV